ncbi:hypothetical protein ACFQJD_17210 [Haloplanus sp. GCM10025708]|uniref:DUF7857 domain-containing protein n=1 Tax=Haloplanus sp. GCM10025708 TaxID=3252679 RepID=UPI00360826CD
MGVVAADDRVSLGYACPASVERPPVSVTDEGRVDDPDDGTTAESAIRELGDPSPPADAVPLPTVGDGGDDADEGRDDAGETSCDVDDESTLPTPDSGGAGDAEPTGAEPSPSSATASRSAAPDDAETTRPADGTAEPTVAERVTPPVDFPSANRLPDGTDEELPESVATWLEAVERRVEYGEGLTDASVVEAADVLESAGGLDAVTSLPETLTADADALRAVATAAERLADRAEETDVPVDALRRLA